MYKIIPKLFFQTARGKECEKDLGEAFADPLTPRFISSYPEKIAPKIFQGALPDVEISDILPISSPGFSQCLALRVECLSLSVKP